MINFQSIFNPSERTFVRADDSMIQTHLKTVSVYHPLLGLRSRSYFGEVGKIGKLKSDNSGMTLLLVVVLLSAILSISIGIFNIIFGQLQISGEIGDSFRALYSADEGVEKMLYRDRVEEEDGVCQIAGPDCYVDSSPESTLSGGCYTTRVSKIGIDTFLRVTGQARCNPSDRVIQRGFSVSY